MRCAHCPADPLYRCPGQGARRLCDLVNPEHAAYRPGYVESVRDSARQAMEPRKAPTIAVDYTPVTPGPCGGCP